jgi:hypothetical protein
MCVVPATSTTAVVRCFYVMRHAFRGVAVFPPEQVEYEGGECLGWRANRTVASAALFNAAPVRNRHRPGSLRRAT